MGKIQGDWGLGRRGRVRRVRWTRVVSTEERDDFGQNQQGSLQI